MFAIPIVMRAGRLYRYRRGAHASLGRLSLSHYATPHSTSALQLGFGFGLFTVSPRDPPLNVSQPTALPHLVSPHPPWTGLGRATRTLCLSSVGQELVVPSGYDVHAALRKTASARFCICGALQQYASACGYFPSQLDARRTGSAGNGNCHSAHDNDSDTCQARALRARLLSLSRHTIAP